MKRKNTPNNGWIKLHRQSLDSQVFANARLWHLWCYCLLKANYQDKQWVPVDGVTLPVLIQRGQFITGRVSLHREAYPVDDPENPSPRTLWRWLKQLEQIDNISIESANKYSLVTVCNYEAYQQENDGNFEACPAENAPKRANDASRSQSPKKRDQQLSSNCPQDKNNKNIYSRNSDEFRLSELLFSTIRKRKADFKPPDLQKWAYHVDKMIRIDNRDPARIEEVIRWCQQDNFWQNNILSTGTLRKQFDQLELKMGPRTEKIPLQRGADGKTPRERMLEAQNG